MQKKDNLKTLDALIENNYGKKEINLSRAIKNLNSVR